MVRGELALNDEIRMTKHSGVIECHVALGMAWSLPFQFRKELEPAARQTSAYLVFRGLESSPLFCRRGLTPVSACHIGIGLDNVAN